MELYPNIGHDMFFILFWVLLDKILFRMSVFIFMGKIGLLFFLLTLLAGFGTKFMVAS